MTSMAVTDADGRLLFCSPARPASCAEMPSQSGTQTGGHVVTPAHRKFKQAPDWYEEMHHHQPKAHSSRRIGGEHGIAHLKNWRTSAHHQCRREHATYAVQANAGLLSHKQPLTLAAGGRNTRRNRAPRRIAVNHARARKHGISRPQ